MKKEQAFALVLVAAFAAGLLVVWSKRGTERQSVPLGGQDVSAAVEALFRRESQVAHEVWGPEQLAQRCDEVVHALWDGILAAEDPWRAVQEFPFPANVVLPEFGKAEKWPLEVGVYKPEGEGKRLDRGQWVEQVEAWKREGWKLEAVEFRQIQFELRDGGGPGRSIYYVAAHAVQADWGKRVLLEGNVEVEWAMGRGKEGGWSISMGGADASELERREGSGASVFVKELDVVVQPPDRTYFIDPLIVRDLDGDGVEEVILAAKNQVWKRNGEGNWSGEPLCRHVPEKVFTAMLEDFTGDGHDDFVYAKFEGLFLIPGDGTGRFDAAPVKAWTAPRRLEYAQSLAAGDVDGDGLADLYLGQYKLPYSGGQMPEPYYDANDGHPDYLLINGGQGKFEDQTLAAGLAKKRWRRTYSVGLLDLDRDGDLDLAVVSDFRGLDLYRNNGEGRFEDVTEKWVEAPWGFGMAHAWSDLNVDGRLDFLMIGMNSPTASRLDDLGLRRPGFGAYSEYRPRMTFGNRLFLGTDEGRWRQADDGAGHVLAKTGWSWGAAVFDLNNDSYPEVYIANGHESGRSVADYEPHFWLQDIFVGSSKEDPVVDAYFRVKMKETRGQGMSYGGYERNRLFLNSGRGEFAEAAHLLGVGLSEDSRNVVAADLDGDGRVDLLVTTFEVWPQVKQTLKIYRNVAEREDHWIGVRLLVGEERRSRIGTTVVVEAGGRKMAKQWIAGESYRSQFPPVLHFGLGQAESVERMTVQWPGGERMVLEEVAGGQYVEVMEPPAARDGSGEGL